MAVSAQPYLPFLTTQLVSPFVDFDTDVIKVMLVETSYTFNNAHQYRSEVVADEVSGDNYTIGGEVITGIFTNTSGGVVSVFGDNTSWGATTIPPGFQATGAVIYKDTGAAATDPVIYFFDFGTTITNLSNNITIPWSTTPLASYFSGGTGGGGGGATSLLDLTDVATASPANRNVLVADGSLFYSRPLTEADISDLQSYRLTSAELNDIPDVSINTVTDNEVLAYDTSGFWINQTPAEAGLATAAQGALADTALQVETNDLTAAVTWANVPDVNITQSSVTQHEAALTLSEGQIESALSTAAAFTANNYTFNTDQIVGVGTDNFVLTFDNASGEIGLEDSTLLEVNDLTANVTWANVPDANITQSSVTQHNAALDHTLLQNIGTNTHAQIDTHIADTTIHFSDAPADAQNYVRVNNTWAVAPTYAFGEYVSAWDASSGSFPVATNQGDWFNVSVAGTVDGQSFIVGDTLIALVDSPSTTTYAANWTTVPNVGITDHTGLTNIGVNTHAQIDTHIADSTIHFTQAAISITESQISDLGNYASISGTPTDNRIAVWTGGTAIEGDGNFLWTGTELSVNGNISLTGNIISPALTNGDIDIIPDGTGNVSLGNFTFNADQVVGVGQDNYVMTYDNATGLINLEAVAVPAEVNDLTAAVTWATVPDAFISQSSVTQHEAALTLSESQIEAALAAATAFTANNYVFNTDQVVGAGQDGYTLVYNNSTGEIELQAAVPGSISGSIAEDQIAFGSATANTIEGSNNFRWIQTGASTAELHLDSNGAGGGTTTIVTLDDFLRFNAGTNGNIFMDDGVSFQGGTSTAYGPIQIPPKNFANSFTGLQGSLWVDQGVGNDVLGRDLYFRINTDSGLQNRRFVHAPREADNSNWIDMDNDTANSTNYYMPTGSGIHTWFNGTTAGAEKLHEIQATRTSIYQDLGLRVSYDDDATSPGGTIQLGNDQVGTSRGTMTVNSANDFTFEILDGAGDYDFRNTAGQTNIRVYGPNNTANVAIQHDNTTGTISTSTGDLSLQPAGASNVLLGNLEFNADTTVGATQDGYVLKYDNATGEIDLAPTDAVLIASGTATNVASLVFTDLVSTYGRYQLVIHDVTPATDAANLNMQVSTDNGSTFVTTATYNWAMMFARIRSTGGSTSGSEGVWQDTSMRIMSNMGTGVGEDGAAIIDIYDPTNINHYTRISTRSTLLSGQPETRTSSVAGEYSATTAVDAFRILMSTGNIASVDYSLYGYRQA